VTIVNTAHATCTKLAGSGAILVEYTHHAGRKEVSGFDIVQSNVAGYLSDRVPDGKYSVDLIELVASEAQLFSHARYISII
jgi:hypothetical protein